MGSAGGSLSRTSSLRTRFALAFALAMGSAILAGGTAVYELSVTSADNHEFMRYGTERVRVAERMHTGLFRAQVDEDRFLTTNAPEDLDAFRTTVRELKADSAAFPALWNQGPPPTSFAAQVIALEGYARAVERAAALTQGRAEVQNPEEYKALMTERRVAIGRAQEASHATLNATLNESADYANRIEERFGSLWFAVTLASAALLLEGALFWRVGGGLVSRVVDMARTVQTMTNSAGSGARLPAEGDDEITTLARRFNGLLDQQAERAAALERANAELRATTEALTSSQQRLVDADKLAVIGQLAAGVAHEINNPTAAVRANLEWLRESLTPTFTGRPAQPTSTEETDEVIVDSLETLQRITTIVKDLGTFSRKDDELEAFDPLEAVEVALKMANHALRGRAAVVKDCAPLPKVHGSRGRLQQVFLNLFVNAAHAMADVRDSRRNELRITARAMGELVMIEVADTGGGIPAETIGRIFDPFFTTKSAGQGTGLGLAISKDIMRRFGGDLAVESEVGVGTRFTLTLPVMGATA